jgi:hypothetical protein
MSAWACSRRRGWTGPTTDIKRLVREYNAQTEIVVAILTGSDQDYYRFGIRGKTPASAFAAVGAQLSELEIRPGELERWAK